MTVSKKQMKAYANKFILRIGPIQTSGRLISLYGTQSKETTFKLCTPDGQSVRQTWQTEDGLCWDKNDLQLGQANDEGVFVVFSAEEIAEQKKSSLPKNILNLNPHPVEQVNAKLHHSKAGSSYVFYPDEDDPVNVDWFNLLRAVVSENVYSLVGPCNLQNHEGLFKLTLWRNQLVLEKQSYPEEINPHEELEKAEQTEEATKKALTLLGKLSTDFNIESYRDTIKEKLLYLKENNVPISENEMKSPVTDSFDILSALENFEVL